MLLSLYKNAIKLSEPFLKAHLKKRASRGKEDPLRLTEREGYASRPRPSGPLIWFHAASVGEALSLLSLIQLILKRFSGLHILVTTGTVTSAKLMADRLPQGAFHQYVPLDHPVWVHRFLDHWQPNLVVWTESELWPNTLSALPARGIPAVLLNARMSERSFRRWQYAPGLIGTALRAFSLCFAQNEAEAHRLRQLGASDVRVSPNLKYAAAPLPCDEGKKSVLEQAIGTRPLILWASTHPGEDEVAVRLHITLKNQYPDLLSIIVPRHPVRGKNIQTLCETAGLAAGLRSAGDLPNARQPIYIADTMGELGIFYRLSKLAIIGGSFADIGGHNPIEPGQVGCVILYGPIMYNFITICEDFESRKAAIRVKDEAELHQKVTAFLAKPATFTPMAEAAKIWTDSNSGVLEDLMARLTPWLTKLVLPPNIGP